MHHFLKLLSVVVIGLLCLWLAAKTLGYVAPFIVSFLAAAAMEPGVSALQRRGLRRSMGAGLLTIMMLTAVGGLIMLCASTGSRTLAAYAEGSPALLERLSLVIDDLHSRIYVLIAAAPHPLQQAMGVAADVLAEELTRLPVWVSEKALDTVSAFAKRSPDWVLFICTAVIGIYFFSAYFTDIQDFFRRQLSDSALQRLGMIRTVLHKAVFGYLKIQCILSAVTFAILLATLSAMGIENKAPTALAIAIVDALPILGAGAVLIPWAVVCLGLGNVSRGLWLMLTYGLVLVTHNVLQTKLMGSHLGLHPVTALVSLYVGWRLGGLAGMLLLPILCVLLCSLNDAKIIHLYR